MLFVFTGIENEGWGGGGGGGGGDSIPILIIETRVSI